MDEPRLIIPEMETVVALDEGQQPESNEWGNADLALIDRSGDTHLPERTGASIWGSELASGEIEILGAPPKGQDCEVSSPAGAGPELLCPDLEIFARPAETQWGTAEEQLDGASYSILSEIVRFENPAVEASSFVACHSLSKEPESVPTRVYGFDSARGEFSEDVSVRVVTATGACLSLRHEVHSDDILRIINLETYFEADFRVIGPTRMNGSRVAEWAVDSLQKDRSIWSEDGRPKSEQPSCEETPYPMQCRACGQEVCRVVTRMETECLNSTGIIGAPCDRCNKPTYWTFAEPARRPSAVSPFLAVAPPPRLERVKPFVDRRAHKRLKLELPILVRDAKGKEDLVRTENVSVGGFAVILTLDLAPGHAVTYICPYGGKGQQIEQQAECRWSAPVSAGGVQRFYGFRRMTKAPGSLLNP